jgi:glycolate oxidase
VIQLAEDEEKVETLWTVRRKCSGAMFRLGNSKLNEDIVVPLSNMTALLEVVNHLRERENPNCSLWPRG